MPVETEIKQSPSSPIRAPRGTTLSCKSWQQEAAMRMLMNNLDQEVAERPGDLVVYGGTGKAARNWDCYHAIVASLKKLENDETLLVQSGKPVGVFKTGYCDFLVTTLDEALRILKNAVRKKEAVSVGLVGNCADIIPELAERGVVPDILTDQTSAHDPLNGYVPNGMSLEAALELRKRDPKAYQERSLDSIARHVEGMLRLQKMGSVTFDYGNNIRTFAFERGVKNAYDFPGFVQAYIRPLFFEGRGPFRWVALSGEASDIAVTDDLVLELFPQNRILRRWIELARKRIKFQGLPARICWLGYGERAQFGLAMNDLVKRGTIKAPIVIGRDHLDCGSVASPFRETEAMRDGSDAIADWAFLNALLNTASGASWVSIHNGGGVGIGYLQHAGQVTVADGTELMAKRIERVLTNDPGIGVARHADAGYQEAQSFADRAGIRIPMQESSASGAKSLNSSSPKSSVRGGAQE